VDVIAGGFDLALVVGAPPVSSLIGLHLGHIRPTLCATVGYLDEFGRPERPEDLRSHRTLRFVSDRGQSHWTLVHEDGEEVTVPVSGQLASNDSRLLFKAVQGGWGIGLFPSWFSTRDAAESLEEVLPGWRFQGFPLYALLPPARRGDPRTRAVLNATREALVPIFEERPLLFGSREQ
jgi:DNA-binding transcriptional LysR family regulator